MKSLVKTFTTLVLLSFFTFTQAQEYQDLSPLDGFTVENADSFGSFLNNLFVFGLGIAGILALIMIVYGGIQYMGSESVFNKDEGKKRITAAIGGLILALLSIVILNTINPNIVDTSGNFKPPVVELTKQGGLNTTDPTPIYDEDGNLVGYDTNGDGRIGRGETRHIPGDNGTGGYFDINNDGTPDYRPTPSLIQVGPQSSNGTKIANEAILSVGRSRRISTSGSPGVGCADTVANIYRSATGQKMMDGNDDCTTDMWRSVHRESQNGGRFQYLGTNPGANNLLPGDLVISPTIPSCGSSGANVGHTAWYVGNNSFAGNVSNGPNRGTVQLAYTYKEWMDYYSNKKGLVTHFYRPL